MQASSQNWHVKQRVSGVPAMAHIEETRAAYFENRLNDAYAREGSDKATLQQKMLLWNKKPAEFAIADIDDIAVKSNVNGLSGAAIDHGVLHRRTGEILV